MKSPWRSYAGCCGILFIHSGLNAIAQAAMPSLTAYYQQDLAAIMVGASICCLAAFAAAFFAEKLIARLQPRKTLMLSSMAGFVFCFIIAYSPTLSGFYWGCFFAGLMAAWGTFVPAAAYIRQMNTDHPGFLTALLSTVCLLGSACFQMITGQLLKIGNVRFCYQIMSLFALAAWSIGFFVLGNIKVTHPASKNTSHLQSNLNPAILLLMLAMGLASPMITIFPSLLTTLLQNQGMNASDSALWLSSYTLLCGFMTLLAGRLFDQVPLHKLILLMIAAYLSGLFFTQLWTARSLVFYLILMLLSYGFAMPITSLSNQLPQLLFQKQALAVHSRFIAMTYLGSIFILPLLTRFYQTQGISSFLILLASLSILVCILFLTAVFMQRKKSGGQL